MTHQGGIDFERLQKDLSDAVSKGYISPLEINPAWVSFRHPDFPLDSAAPEAGRFHEDNQTAFYLASGDYCGQYEVPTYYERVPCDIAPHTVYAFDLYKFSEDYGWGDTFLKSREQGGWEIGQAASNILTNTYGVSGLLYQSAACHRSGCFGYCMAILPGEERKLPPDFFTPR